MVSIINQPETEQAVESVSAETATEGDSGRRPGSRRHLNVLFAGATVSAVAWAAAWGTDQTADKDVGIAAWVAVAVVGASAMIAAAKYS